jgi:tripartite-type tricarboxylate transporter receptor subunit TctC
MLKPKEERMSVSKVLAVVFLSLISLAGNAQTWPDKVVKFVSPYPPGGSVDPLARLLAAKLSDSLKQQFIVENRTGASGIIGTDYVAKSDPDGYTYVFIFDTHLVHQALNPKLSFDPIKDFEAVMLVGTAPMAFSTGAQKPYKTFQDVVAAAKAKPDTITVGNVGNGSLGHLTTILLNQATGLKLVSVPYKGGGPLHVDALGGQIDLAIASVAAQANHVRNGKLRALVQTGEKRSQLMPDVPTLAEAGVKGVDPAYALWGILAPAKTPQPIIAKLNAELAKVLQLPDVKKTLTQTLGMDIQGLSPAETEKFLVSQIQRWGKVVKDNNIKND